MRQHLLLALIIILSANSGSLIQGQEAILDLYYSGSYNKVLEQTGTLIESGDTAFNTFYLQALSEAQLGQTAMAIKTLELALISHPDDTRLLRMLAGQLFEAGYYVQARKSYSELVQKDSLDVGSWLKLAEIASFRQHDDQVIKALNQVLQIDSLNLTGLMKMGDILNKHKHDGAISYYEKAYRLYPDNQQAAFALGNLNIQAQEAWLTVPICEHILSIDTTSIKFSKLLGYTYYKMGEPVDGARYFEYANLLGDSSTFSFKFKGICHYLRLDFDAAIQSLQIAEAKDTLDAEIYFFLGSSMATGKEKELAMAHLNKSLRLMQPDPKISSRIYSEQGNLKRLETEYEEAYALYEKAWNTDSSNVMSLYFMASILDNSMHKSREALVDYQHYIDALDRLPEKEES
ncbi:MAG: tetratricopeptide repeat protein, partial [Bacteroides sp.]|nr:tetratricopeptide repeat protein [Bacteroides sp.]